MPQHVRLFLSTCYISEDKDKRSLFMFLLCKVLKIDQLRESVQISGGGEGKQENCRTAVGFPSEGMKIFLDSLEVVLVQHHECTKL